VYAKRFLTIRVTEKVDFMIVVRGRRNRAFNDSVVSNGMLSEVEAVQRKTFFDILDTSSVVVSNVRHFVTAFNSKAYSARLSREETICVHMRH